MFYMIRSGIGKLAVVLLLQGFTPLILTGQEPVNQTDAAGLKQGLWIKTYPGGKPMYEGRFADDLPAGTWKRYHENGAVKAILEYVAPGDTAAALLFDTNGKQVAEGRYFRELKTGRWYYFADGVKVAEETYNGGQKEGLCSKYYKSGELLESSWWKGDRREGLYRAFYTNGRPYLECRYAGGARNGPCVSYHPSGEAEIEAFYENDLPHGPWKYYDEKGTLLITLHYDRGLLLNADQLRKLDSARLEELEKQRGRLVDPENYLQNPEEILFRKP